ncbi:hypothetical protein P154DRAFT_546637 [Amniculicola lignicola CBS 123094]|uniref:Alpha/beta-hydrolase n=1 Tax=Amniculicola lignicola CBS 123094 TaxID=1392246 RepID=A0A6A5WIH6_9PLEO|nr:hypothetical protein P154DRAFT_546637 [Amniculicola lignicola CBS 123094]
MSPRLPTTIHLHSPAAPSSKPPSRTYLIYYIPGNPGLIAFYTTFLTHLYGLLTADSNKTKGGASSVSFQIYGRDLSGFELATPTETLVKRHGHAPPYSLQEQIEHCETAIEDVVRREEEKGVKDVRVVVMGHSLGTWLSLEVTRRLRERAKGIGEGVRVVGDVCLFTTIVDLKGSRNGRRFGWALSHSWLPRALSLLLRSLLFVVPLFVVKFFVKLVNGFPGEGADVTASFIKSRYGIYESLCLAQEEMRDISVDRWDEEIWGAAHETKHPHKRPVLRVLFGKDDRWVSDETRDALIKARGASADGSEKWKPKMEIDEEEGWPHDFCIRHSIPVAERVKGYIDDIVEADQKGS